MVTPNVRLVQLLGQGGMGSVWVAEHLTLDTQVAVKFISPEVAQKEGKYVLDRFEREAKAAAKIKSPHVVRTYDYGIMPGGIPYMVMELLEGQTLAEHLEDHHTVTLDMATQIVTQAARALKEAHKFGIVHRDIKPENIFLLGSGYDLHVKVLDFGIAKQPHTAGKQALTGTHTMIGTPLYMSPEQLLAPKTVDHQTDLWALGVVAYEMLTGVAPFSGETLAALSLSICGGAFVPLAEQTGPQSVALDEWFDRALSKQSRDRFESAKELAVAFELACAPETVRGSAQRERRLQLLSGTRPVPAISATWSRDEWMVQTGDGSAPAGPVSLTEVQQAINTGTIAADSMLAPVGSSDWRDASAILAHAAQLAQNLSSLPQPVADEPTDEESEVVTAVSVPY
ncbi:MAG: serine/threonine protein kinase, partial [Deltaproteobacteria bacterium]